MNTLSAEEELCDLILGAVTGEQPISRFAPPPLKKAWLLLSDGFEERSLGIAEALAGRGLKFTGVALGMYSEKRGLNERFAERLRSACSSLCADKPLLFENRNDGRWVAEALERLRGLDVSLLLDITALSGRGIFGALDSLASWREGEVVLGYSEAREYWPTRTEWTRLKRELGDERLLPAAVDAKPWLFGFQHSVELIAEHEGFSTGTGMQALVAFLPFKCARLGAILGAGEYGRVVLIAGKPRLKKNVWRLQALKEINSSLIRTWPVAAMSTFGYRTSLKELFNLLFRDRRLMDCCDVHLAVTGSKLQTVASWLFSTIVRSVAVISSTPVLYYPESFSEGVGHSWFFQLTPSKVVELAEGFTAHSEQHLGGA